jgi:tetraacyldisaccharide 4'-kinase
MWEQRTAFDVDRLKKIFENMKKSKKAILTTEKDAMRLELHRDFLVEKKMPIFVLPVEVRFHFDEGAKFDADLKEFLLNFR